MAALGILFSASLCPWNIFRDNAAHRLGHGLDNGHDQGGREQLHQQIGHGREGLCHLPDAIYSPKRSKMGDDGAIYGTKKLQDGG